MTPEAKARLQIDQKLEQAGWIVQGFKQINLGAGLGVAVREYPTDTGPADYVLFVNREPAGVIEAKADNVILTFFGSSQISVRVTQFSECPQPEVVKVSVSEGDTHHGPQCAIEPLDESIGNTIDEVDEDFFPPVAECGNKFGQVFVSGGMMWGNSFMGNPRG